MVKLRGRLVVPRTPRLPAIDGHNRALIADDKNNVWIIRIDPEILVVVTAGRAANAHPGLAAIRRSHGDDARAVHHVRILGIHPWNWKIAAADAHRRTRISRSYVPVFSGIIRAVNAETGAGTVLSMFGRGHRRIEAAGLAGCNGHIDLREVLGQAFGQWMPGIAAVRGLEKSSAGSLKLVVILPRPLACFPQ